MAVYDFPPPENGEAHGTQNGSFKAHALYDFEGQPGTGELSIRCGEVLTVIRTDVGDGWWEGMNTSGESGLFPTAYVEEMSSDAEDGPPSMAPPPLPPDYGASNGGGNLGWSHPTASAAPGPAKAAAAPPADDDWGSGGASSWGLPPAAGKTQKQPQQQQQESGWNANDYNQAGSGNAPEASSNNAVVSSNANTNQAFDEDWDSDFDEPGSTQQMPPPAAPGQLGVPQRNAQSGSSGDLSSMGRSDSRKQGGAGGGGGAGAAAGGRTSFNRFTPFVKSGGENFVLGKLNVNVQESDLIQVVDQGSGTYSWLNTHPPYNCAIASPKKESKLKGLKSFIAYQLTPSFNNIQVSRRYKHFDWLHERLEQKFTFIPIPPLPDKQIQGRYENEFIDHRMFQLQSFVDRVCRHPILSQSEVWQHFLTCTDEKRWKSGKRKAEKDPLLGGSLFMAIKTPDKPLDQAQLEHQVTVFTGFSNCMDSAVKNMLKTCADQTQKYQTHFKREYQVVGKAFQQLGVAMQQDGTSYSPNLTDAITTTGESYEDIGRMFDDQPKHDWERMGDVMHAYRGLLAGWPGVLQVHAGAISKRREFERLAIEGKVGQAESMEMGNRTDILSYAMLAEINTFHSQRVADMKVAHQSFLEEQIRFYQKITEKLQDALRKFDAC